MTREEEHLLREKYAGVVDEAFAHDCRRLASGEPLGYVIGWQPFLELKIYLDSRPLIPRVETEWWVENVVSSLQEQKAAHHTFLDLCAGSGAIGCAALKHTNAEVYFGEIDPAHQMTIEKNIRENGLDASRAHIAIGDLFEPFGTMRFDLIACNPPYIPAGRELDKSVADYEPALALRSGADGLDLIRHIAAELPKHLTRDGTAYIECDSAHVSEARALFERAGFLATIRTDQFKAPRLLVVRFPQ